MHFYQFCCIQSIKIIKATLVSIHQIILVTTLLTALPPLVCPVSSYRWIRPPLHQQRAFRMHLVCLHTAKETKHNHSSFNVTSCSNSFDKNDVMWLLRFCALILTENFFEKFFAFECTVMFHVLPQIFAFLFIFTLDLSNACLVGIHSSHLWANYTCTISFLYFAYHYTIQVGV